MNQDFLLNNNFSMLQVPSSNLIPLNTGVVVMRKLTLTFNVENRVGRPPLGRTFDLGYLNYKKDTKNVRHTITHCYYLSRDTRLVNFINFLDKEAHNKVDNVTQVILKVTVNSKRTVYYTLVLKGDSSFPISFKPSQFKDHDSEVDSTFTQAMEPLVNSIINEEKEKRPNDALKLAFMNYSQQIAKETKEVSIEQQIISIGKELEEIRLLRDKKIQQLKELLNNYDLPRI